MGKIVWRDMIGRVVSFKFKSQHKYERDSRRHGGIVVLYPRGLGIMTESFWIGYTVDGIDEETVIVLPIEEEIIWKIECNYNENHPSNFIFRPIKSIEK